ncbi:methyltransferase small [Clostridium sp. CAG:465]|nr:methyltransferase small [Clostridium sp. CAG:465]
MEIRKNERIDDLGINDLKIIQNKEYFCFGTDSVLLANFVKSENSNNVILDICSGSGVIPIILSAKKKYKKIFGVELQSEMYDLFDRNIKINNLEDSIISINENVKNIKDIRKKVTSIMEKDKIDIITCNPPYKEIGTGLTTNHDVKTIAKCEVMCNLEDIFITSSKLLGKGGKLYLVHKPERLSDLIYFGRKYNLEAKEIRFVYPKIDKKPSIVLISYRKDGGNETKVLEPLIEYNDDMSYTDEIYRIYGINGKC